MNLMRKRHTNRIIDQGILKGFILSNSVIFEKMKRNEKNELKNEKTEKKFVF